MTFAMAPDQSQAAYGTRTGDVCMLDAQLLPTTRMAIGTGVIRTLAWPDDSTY